MNSANHKCPSCSAPLIYNPKSKAWDCDYCGSKFTLNELKENKENFDDIKVPKDKPVISSQFSKEMDVYTCPDCGAEIITDKNTASTFCVYCKNSAILKDKLSGKYAPAKIIPFKNSKEDAINAFKKIGKGKLLMPNEFSDVKNIEEMRGIYIPFWLYDCTVSGIVQYNATKVRTWRNGDYQYTKTDTYLVKRGGEINFSKIPVDGSIRFDDAVMNSIEPFNYDDLEDFNISYLSGFLSEKYDVDNTKVKDIAIKRIEKSFLDNLNQKVVGYATKMITDKSISILNEYIEYTLLPVWLLNIKYNDKMYTFAMNGQTGKMVGDIPYSKKKVIICFLIVMLVSFIVIAATSYFA